VSSGASRATRAYRFLLKAYPSAFRRLWARDMEEDFAALHRRARERGAGATLRLWVAATADVARSGASERLSTRGYRFGRTRLRLPRGGAASRLADLASDLRQAVRTLARSRGYVAAVVATLALGIGANTALFSVAWGVLLRPLPFGSGERLVRITQGRSAPASADVEGSDLGFSVKDLEDYAALSATLEAVAEYHRMSFTLADERGPHRVSAGVVSSNYSEFLGLRPLHGRLFDPEEDHLGADPVLVLSHEYWQERFAGDPGVVGRSVRMNGEEHRIVGVLPPTPQFPHSNDIYLPISACPTRTSPSFMADREARMMYAYARVLPGVGLAALRMDLERVAGGLRERYGAAYDLGDGYRVGAVPLREELVGRARPVVVALVAVSAFLLLIACANAGSLALARARRRARELDVRHALGAGPGRLARSLLIESVLLALVGGLLGLGVAVAGHDVLVRFAARPTTRAQEIRLDRVVLLFTFGASVLTGLVFGAVPGWRAGRTRELPGRMGGGRTSSRHDRRVHRSLVAVQVAVAFGVLATAGLTLRAAWDASRSDPGFAAEAVLTFHVSLDGPRYTSRDSVRAFWNRLGPRVAALPGVRAVGRAWQVPFEEGAHDHREAFFIKDAPEAPGSAAAAAWRVVDAGFFDVLELPVELGTGFEEAARRGRIALVNRTFHDRYLRDRSGVGTILRRCVEAGVCDRPLRIVGVVADVRFSDPTREPIPEVYEPSDQLEWGGEDVLVRAAGDPHLLDGALRAVVARVDGEVAVSDVATLEELRRERIAPHRFFAVLLILFAVVGAGLALAGVFGVASLAAASRMRELGVRRVLGASHASLRGIVLREGCGMAAPGLLAGLGLALAGGFLLARALPDLAPVQPGVLAATAALFLAAVLAAAWLPARRAARADASEILNDP
jgi:predicted permease